MLRLLSVRTFRKHSKIKDSEAHPVKVLQRTFKDALELEKPRVSFDALLTQRIRRRYARATKETDLSDGLHYIMLNLLTT